jgi:hypothetical protein
MMRIYRTCLGVFLGLSSAWAAIRVAHGQCGPATLRIQTPDCAEVGAQLQAEIQLVDSELAIIGGQFFLSYNPAILSVVSVTPGDEPFNLPLFLDLQPPGEIDYAIGIFPLNGPGTSEDTVMARILFNVIGNAGEPYIRFRPHDPPTPNTLLAHGGGGLIPHMVNATLGGSTGFDLQDFRDFQRCFRYRFSATGECQCFWDVDGDADVDLVDYTIFLSNLSGPEPGICNP